MNRIAFRMKLHNGRAAEYKARHDAIWPELQNLLKEAGIFEYSIFLDEETHNLFAYLKIGDPKKLDELPLREIMRRWWHFMSDIMDANPDHSPVIKPLIEVFYLP